MAAARNRPTWEFDLKQDSAYFLFYDVVKTKNVNFAGRLFQNLVSVIQTHSSLSHVEIPALNRSDNFSSFCCRIGWMIEEIFATAESIPWPEPPPSFGPDVSGDTDSAVTPVNLSALWDELGVREDVTGHGYDAENRCSVFNSGQEVAECGDKGSGTGRRPYTCADSEVTSGLSGPVPTMVIKDKDFSVRKFSKKAVEVRARSPVEPDTRVEVRARRPVEPDTPVEVRARRPVEPDTRVEVRARRPVEPDTPVEVRARRPVEPDIPVEVRARRPVEPDTPVEVRARKPVEPDASVEVRARKPVDPDVTGQRFVTPSAARRPLVQFGQDMSYQEAHQQQEQYEGATPNFARQTHVTGQRDIYDTLNYTIQRLTLQQEESTRLLLQQATQQNAETVLAGSGFEKFDGSRTDEFKSWLFGLENRLRLTKTTDDDVKVGHLVNCLTGLARQQFHEDLVNPTFYAAVNYLKEKYADSRYDALKFQQFRSRVQQRGETIESYARDLKLAFPFQQCDSQQSNLMLMEQLQRGLQEAEYRQYVQERLLNPKKSFDDVVNKLSLKEMAKNTADVKERGRYYDSQHHEARVRLTRHQAQSDKKTFQCYRCQEFGHYASTCNNNRISRSYCEPYLSHEYAYAPQCYSHYQYDAHPYWYQQQYQGDYNNLSELGYEKIESQVPKPTIEYPPMPAQQQQSVTKSVTCAAVGQDSKQKPQRIGVCRVRSVKIACARSPIYVNSQKVPDSMWHPDTGAHCNLVTSQFLNSIEGPLVEKPCTETLTCIDGLKTECRGFIKLAVSIGELTKQIQFYVIEEFHGKIGLVLGMPALNAFGFSLKNDNGFDLTPNISAASDEKFVGIAKFVALKKEGRGAKPLKCPEKKRKNGVYWKKFAGECNFEKRVPKIEHESAAETRKTNCSSTQSVQTERVKPQPRYKSFDCTLQIKPQNVKQPCHGLKCAKAQRMRHEARITVMKPYSAQRNNASDWSRSDYKPVANSEPGYDPRFRVKKKPTAYAFMAKHRGDIT